MSGFTRLTVVGSSRRATVVVPSDEPVGTLVADIAELIAEPAAPAGLTLVDFLGVEVERAVSVADQGVVDGSVFRLIPVADALPPPEVADVTDVVAARYDATAGRWNRTHRLAGAGASLGVLSATATLGAGVPGWVAAVVFVAGVVVAVAGFWLTPRFGMLAAAVAVGAVPATAFLLVGVLPPAPGLVIPVGYGLIWVAAGACGSRSGLVGAAVGVGVSAVAVLLLLLGVPVAGVSAVVVVLVTGCLGMLPVLAVNVSGLATLDDRVIAGDTTDRVSVAERVDAAYRMFGWAVYALAGAGAVAGTVLLGDGGLWAGLLGVAVVLVLLLRTRVMPLAYQAWPLWAAGFTAIVFGTLLRGGVPVWVILTGCALLAALLVVFVTVKPRRHSRIRLRRAGDLLETVAALSMVPVSLGVFGVYELALGVFR